MAKFLTINRGIPDNFYIVVKNKEAATTMVDGDCVMWDLAASQNFGVDVLLATSALPLRLAGVIAGADITPAEYGAMQIYGYHSNVKADTAVTPAGVTVKAPGSVTGRATLGVPIVDATTVPDDSQARLGLVAVAAVANRAGVIIQKM